MTSIMRRLRTIRLIWAFYTSFLLASILITVLCLHLFRLYGFSSFFALFWFKIATLGITYYFVNSHKKQEYYYYRNLGVSRTLLWTVTLTFDFILFLFLITWIYHFK